MFVNCIEVKRRQSWEENTGKLFGKVEFVDNKGLKIEVPLDERLSKEVVGLCAEALVRSAQEAAHNMVAETIAETKLMIEEGQ